MPSSVQSLGRWLYSRGHSEGHNGSPMQVRLDTTTEKDLAQLAEAFGMARATLAQEIIRAGVQDVKSQKPAVNPGGMYATVGDVLDDEEMEKAGLTDPDMVMYRDGKPVLKEEA